MLDIGAIVTGVGGGLALFLFGMRRMTEALGTVAGSSMKALLGKLTANRFTGAAAGAIVTGVVQSSSVTTVLIVGFLTAGLMTFPQSIGVIIGANIGTTLTAQIIAFRINEYGLLLIALGFFIELASRKVVTRQYGMALMGLGLVFFGMELMTGATGPLGTYPPFLQIMESLEHPLAGVLAGFLFTGLVQSSSATTGIVIVLAGEGLIALEAGVAIVLGANIGTCVTAVLSALGRPRQAVQAAFVHVVFNVLGVLVWLPFVAELAAFVREMSPVDTARQIANAHTVFNVANAVLFIGFTGPLARLVERLVPTVVVARQRGRPEYLDEYFISQPALALDRVRMELTRLARLVEAMLGDTLEAILGPRREALFELAETDEEVNALHGAIVLYLGQISQQNLRDSEAGRAYENILIANHLETMGDIVDKNLVEAGHKRLELGVAVSPETRKRLTRLHQLVLEAFGNTVLTIETGDPGLAKKVVDSKKEVNDAAEDVMSHLAERLVAQEPHRLASFQVETDIVENLKRLNNVTRRIARIAGKAG